MFGEFLSIQVIYEAKTTRCLPKYALSEDFDITFTEKYWSKTEKTISFIKKSCTSSFQKCTSTKDYPNEQVALVIMDTFKGQDNEEIR